MEIFIRLDRDTVIALLKAILATMITLALLAAGSTTEAERIIRLLFG